MSVAPDIEPAHLVSTLALREMAFVISSDSNHFPCSSGHHGSTGASTTGTSSVGGHSSSSAGTGTGVGSSFTHGPGEKENTSAATHATSAGAYDSKRGDGVFDVPSSALENSGPTRSSNATTTIGDSPGTATIHRTRHDETFDKTGSSPPLTTGSANKQDDGVSGRIEDSSYEVSALTRL